MTPSDPKQQARHTPTPWDRKGRELVTSRGVIAQFPLPQDGGVFDVQDNVVFAWQAVNSHSTGLKLAEAVLESLPILENGIPEKAHEGSCVAGITNCDASCSDHFHACEAFGNIHRLAAQYLRESGAKR